MLNNVLDVLLITVIAKFVPKDISIIVLKITCIIFGLCILVSINGEYGSAVAARITTKFSTFLIGFALSATKEGEYKGSICCLLAGVIFFIWEFYIMNNNLYQLVAPVFFIYNLILCKITM